MFGINYLKEHFTHDQRYILVAILSLFIPFYMCATVITLLFIRLVLKGEIKDLYRSIPYSRFIILFCIIIFMTSLLYKNYLGMCCSVLFYVFLSFILYYRKHITANLFNFIINCIIVLSVFAALYGLIEYMAILNKFDINQFEIIIFNSPKNRINSVFFNANYYAMMIEFFVCITFYQILKTRAWETNMRRFVYYFAVIALNLFLLILTACRTAWPALAVAILIMLIFDKHYRTCAVIFSLFLLVVIYFIFNPTKFPRVDNIISYFFTRTDIWEVALMNIKTHPLFGEGPLTYLHVFKSYGGHPTQHAHSLYIDPFLSFGIVGVASIAPFVLSQLRRTYILFKTKTDRTLVALILGFIAANLVHGALDYTVFFVQTGILFMLITASFDIYKKEIDEYKKVV